MILVDFASKNQARKLKQSLNSIGEIILFALRLFNIRSLSDEASCGRLEAV